MSPLALEMLAWACTRAKEAGSFKNLHLGPQSEIWGWFWHEGIIDREDEFGRATDKGRAWLSMILGTPMPKQQWIDPRTKAAIEDWP